ncbi:Maf family protein [Microvirga pudoricolor]|uniref:Maf family protein n=1 Tax=Microvirga pudoricolor TaxID=2778729 RepID=UPI00194E0B8F|nr:nucleoside triphosphate pyrophosphatase [Microvirga pudoricolor]MBM6593914.1 Maf-like protein [Microvirga pudoricolor]
MPPVWAAPSPLLLASTSRTRRALLESAGIVPETEAPGVDERAIEMEAASDRLSPPALAARLAREKALAVSRRHPARIVLGADQVLACDGILFHKPGGRDEAFEQLSRLSGRTHALHAAGCLARDGEILSDFDATARLTMRELGPDAINLYLDRADSSVLVSTGVYQVEGLGIHLFERIEGDHSTILGLPLIPLLSALRGLGCLAF